MAVDSNSFTKIFVKSDKEFFVEWNSYITYLNIIYIILVIICILLSLYWIFEDEFMIFIKCAFVLGVGFFSAVGMGFSPTLYATGERAFLFFYFALIYVGVQLCLTADKNKLFSLLEKRLMDTAIAFWTLKNILLTVLLLI